MDPQPAPYSPHAQKPPAEDTTLDYLNFSLHVITLLVTIVGGIAGYFFIYKPLTSLEVDLKQNELAKQTTPVLGVTPTPIVREASDKLKSVVVDVLLENLGTAAVELGEMSIQVQEAAVSEEVKKVFDRNKELNRFEPVYAPPIAPSATPPPAPTPKSTKEKLKLIQMVGSDGLDWKRSTVKERTRNLNYSLLPGQKRSVQFEFIVWEEDPTWYRFVVTAEPKSAKDNWQKIEVHVVVPCGPMPMHTYNISKPVYETRVTTAAEALLSPPPSAPPVPR